MEKKGVYRSLSGTSYAVHKRLGHEYALGIACRKNHWWAMKSTTLIRIERERGGGEA